MSTEICNQFNSIYKWHILISKPKENKQSPITALENSIKTLKGQYKFRNLQLFLFLTDTRLVIFNIQLKEWLKNEERVQIQGKRQRLCDRREWC